MGEGAYFSEEETMTIDRLWSIGVGSSAEKYGGFLGKSNWEKRLYNKEAILCDIGCIRLVINWLICYKWLIGIYIWNRKYMIIKLLNVYLGGFFICYMYELIG